MTKGGVATITATDRGAVQIDEAYGVAGDTSESRTYRDSKVFRIVEGTTGIHRKLIAEHALGWRK